MAAPELVKIEIDEHKLKRIQKMLRDVPRAMPKVVSRAINKTAGSSKVQIARKIHSEMKIKIKISDIKKGIKIYKATYTRWYAILTLMTKRIPLIKLSIKKLPRHTFYATMPTGHRGIFIRGREIGKAGTKGFRRELKQKAGKQYWTELPIYEKSIPSIGEMYRRGGKIAIDVQRDSAKTLERNLDSQIEYILSRTKTG